MMIKVTRTLVGVAGVLRSLGLNEESDNLLKEATLHGVMTLGYSDTAAKTINKIVGDKWDFVISKWIFETVNSRNASSVQDYVPGPSSLNSLDIVAHLKAVDGCRQLMNKTEEQRFKIFETRMANKNILNLYNMCEKEKEFESFLKQEELSQRDLAYLRLDSSPTPDENLRMKKEELQLKVEELIKKFISNEFVSDVISGSWLPPAAAKELSYIEAQDRWANDKTPQLPVILEVEGGWKWIDAGSGKSDWVRKKLKNCGSSGWGNLRATSESQKLARMLILIDSDFEPHAIATWNPEYMVSPDGEKKSFLGSIEGVGSSALKDEYYPYVTQLINHLNPDQVYIPGRMEYHESGRLVSNDNLKALIDSKKLIDQADDKEEYETDFDNEE